MRTVFISGAGGDIGLEITRAFLEKDVNLVLTYNTSWPVLEKLLEEYPEKSGVLLLECDMTDRTQIKECIRKTKDAFGGIDVLINNAGMSHVGFFDATTDRQWDELVSVNLTACYMFCREFSKEMIKNRYGRIINISSIWGDTGASMEVMYSATKAGVNGLTKALAQELGPTGITVNAVSPGVIDTKMNRHLSREELDDIVERTSMSRLGSAADVADAVSFLASERASFITGQIITVDGVFNI